MLRRIAPVWGAIWPAMGGATGINFQPTGGGKAAITGDFVLLGSEVNDVVRALRTNGIEVMAIHSHMLTSRQRIPILALPLPKRPPKGAEWIDAYRRWACGK